MLKLGEYIERILLHALQSLEKCVDHGITDVLCQIQYAVPLQSYKVVSGCDMHWIVSCRLCLQSLCMHLLISMRFISAGQGRNQRQKSNIVLLHLSKKPVAALHIPNQPTVDLRLLASQAWQNMLNNYKCLPSSNTAHFAMRN